MSLAPPPLPPIEPTWPQFQAWWQLVLENLNEQLTDLFSALSFMPDIPDVTITADYTGAVDTGQLPKIVQAYRFTNTTDNTTDATWSYTLDSGDLTATITDGALEITAITVTSVVTVTSTYQSVDKSRTFTVHLETAAPPSSVGSSTDTSFASINSTTLAPISDELTVTVGGTGGVACIASNLTVTTDAVTPSGSFSVQIQWQWWDGAAWVNIGSASTSSLVRVASGTFAVTDGRVSKTATKTGLTPAASEKFRLEAKNSSGTRVMYFAGHVTAATA
jgi:hypothetical protein